MHVDQLGSVLISGLRFLFLIASLPVFYLLISRENMFFTRLFILLILDAGYFFLILPLGPWTYYLMIFLNIIFYIKTIEEFYDALNDLNISPYPERWARYAISLFVGFFIFGGLLLFPDKVSNVFMKKTLTSINVNGVTNHDGFYVGIVFGLILMVLSFFSKSGGGGGGGGGVGRRDNGSGNDGQVITPPTTTPIPTPPSISFTSQLNLFHGTDEAIAREVYASGRWMIGESNPKGVWLTSDFSYAVNHAKKGSSNIAIIEVLVDSSKLTDRGGGIYVYPAPDRVDPYEKYYKVPAIQHLRMYDESQNIIM